ncbi:MAG: hypothetical protein ABR575_00235 [Actinomycetota bacterium]
MIVVVDPGGEAHEIKLLPYNLSYEDALRTYYDDMVTLHRRLMVIYLQFVEAKASPRCEQPRTTVAA